jgi:hypothetical protein
LSAAAFGVFGRFHVTNFVCFCLVRHISCYLVLVDVNRPLSFRRGCRGDAA